MFLCPSSEVHSAGQGKGIVHVTTLLYCCNHVQYHPGECFPCFKDFCAAKKLVYPSQIKNAKLDKPIHLRISFQHRLMWSSTPRPMAWIFRMVLCLHPSSGRQEKGCRMSAGPTTPKASRRRKLPAPVAMGCAAKRSTTWPSVTGPIPMLSRCVERKLEILVDLLGDWHFFGPILPRMKKKRLFDSWKEVLLQCRYI